jgi:hypothetical protein
LVVAEAKAKAEVGIKIDNNDLEEVAEINTIRCWFLYN